MYIYVARLLLINDDGGRVAKCSTDPQRAYISFFPISYLYYYFSF